MVCSQIVLASLSGKAEEGEEHDSAEHEGPPIQLQDDGKHAIRAPEGARKDVDRVPIKVNIRPTLPRVNGVR